MNEIPCTEVSDNAVEVLKKIPLFERLTLPEFHKVFAICSPQRYRAGETLYRIGLPSLHMFILLEGKLAVRTSAGVEGAHIHPLDLVG